MKYHVCFFYLATGMEGRAYKRDVGLIDAASAEEAKDKVTLAEFPTDIFYGPDGRYSTRAFFKGCLSATEI